MLIYNETIKIDHDIEQEWLRWMKRIYMPRMLETGKFHDCKICRLMGVDEADGRTYAAQFTCPNRETFNLYQEQDAYRLQKTLHLRYQDRYVAFRTLMEVV